MINNPKITNKMKKIFLVMENKEIVIKDHEAVKE
jgi:hypothetical protein